MELIGSPDPCRGYWPTMTLRERERERERERWGGR